MSVSAVGMVWYKRQDYKRVLQIMEDADVLPPTYDKWLHAAEKAMEKMKRSGHMVVRAYIDPQTFPAWCVEHGLTPDANARSDFASRAARAQYQRGNA
jgi:hypothetical protein